MWHFGSGDQNAMGGDALKLPLQHCFLTQGQSDSTAAVVLWEKGEISGFELWQRGNLIGIVNLTGRGELWNKWDLFQSWI